jgi:hypothetical protein
VREEWRTGSGGGGGDGARDIRLLGWRLMMRQCRWDLLRIVCFVEGLKQMGAKIEVDEQLLYTNSQNRLMREKIRRVFDLMLMN